MNDFTRRLQAVEGVHQEWLTALQESDFELAADILARRQSLLDALFLEHRDFSVDEKSLLVSMLTTIKADDDGWLPQLQQVHGGLKRELHDLSISRKAQQSYGVVDKFGSKK
ncbi:flagellar protein FliT [Aeromonas caviae]|uniref:flagellar protein FliT n=1 Tax=Aeromonas caviae TaxID=648 RepID=UPI0015DCFF15|nr:flagellar protein FliT [Aeromonas caviae]BBS17645.1 hypothetical protein WP5W18E02_26820 [Aeromonas caviae]